MSDTKPKGPNGHERSPLQSKKFVAYLIAEITWKVVIAALVWVCREDLGLWMPILLSIVLVAGFIEAGFILGQASLDRYVRVAQITAGSVAKMTSGGLSGGKPPMSPEDEGDPDFEDDVEEDQDDI